MLPQLLGEDSAPNEAVPTPGLVDDVLLLVVVLVLVDKVLRFEVVVEVTLVDEVGVPVDVEFKVEAWVVLDVTGSGVAVPSMLLTK